MGLTLTEEQKMLKESAAEFLQTNANIDNFRKLRDNNYESFDKEVWNGFIEMGWTALIIPEIYGGLDFGYTGLGQILEESGKTLTKSPLISSILLSATALRLSDNEGLKTKWLPELMNGKILMSLAVDERSFFDPLIIDSKAISVKDNYILNGEKKMVIDGNLSDHFIVAAKLNNSLSLFLVDSKSKGIKVNTDILMDAGSYSSINFENVSIPFNNKLDIDIKGEEILKPVLEIAAIGLSCERLGSVQAAFNKTMEYIKERQQFGVKIGSYQGLQHRAANLFCEIELCKSIIIKALQAIDNKDSNLSRYSHLSKAKLGEVLKLTSNEAIQMHGGIGVTDDVNIGFYLKRARVVQRLFGDTNYHLSCIAKQNGY